MRRFLLLALTTSMALSAFAQKKKEEKREIPDQVLVARYIYVTGWHGDLYDPRTPPEERTAINRVQTAIHDWGRYRLALGPGQADLMLVVKPGHIGMVQGGVGLGVPDIGAGTPPPSSRQPGPFGTAIGYGAEAGNPDDYLMLTLFPTNNPFDATYIWKRRQNNGFQGRKIPLFEEFRKAVEESDKLKDASKKP